MRVKGIIQGLQDVATFLNAIGPRTTPAQWDGFRRKLRSYWATSGPSISLDDAKTLQAILTGDLGFLRSDSSLNRPFDTLVERLNNLQLKSAWRYEPLAPKSKPRDPSQAILKMRGDNGTMERWMVQSWSVTTTLMDHFYAILGKALETGALNRLRVCRECGKYIVVADLKRRFCPESTKCHDDYHNRETHAANRDKRRETAILMAKRLKDAGKSDYEIRDRTRLPIRVVAQMREGQLPHNRHMPTVVRSSPASPAVVTRLRRVLANEQHQAEAYAKNTRLVECPQCHRRRMVPIGVRARCDHTDRTGTTPTPTPMKKR